MAKVVNITGHTPHPRKRAQRNQSAADAIEEDLSDIDNSLFWLDSLDDEQLGVMTMLPRERIAAIVVKGCFALYHLVREHKRRRTPVPEYLLRLAREHENPLIPAAEALYVEYFEGGSWPDHIPDGLLDLGSCTANSVVECTHHASRLHRLLEAIGSTSRADQQKFFKIRPSDEGAMLLVQVMIARHRSWLAGRSHRKPA